MYGFIYITTNHVNGKKYIGQKKYDNKGKWKDYLGSGKHLKNAINKYGRENFSKEIIEECETKELLNEREKYWIKYYNAVNNNNFYNLATGGDGGVTVIGDRHPLSKMVYQYDLLTGCYIQSWENAQRASEYLNICVSDIHLACRDDHRIKKAGEYMWRYYMTDKLEPYVREAMSKESILQLDKDFNIINKYKNISYVDSSIYNKERITNCCKKRLQFSHKGYYWVYEKDYNDDYKEYIKNRILSMSKPVNTKTILQFENGKLINTYDSAKEASENTGIKSGTIQAYCKRGVANYGINSKYGYEWRYA